MGMNGVCRGGLVSRRWRAVRGLCLLALLTWGLLGAPPVSAATFTVTTLLDAPNVNPVGTTCVSTLGGGPCTLRAAIQAANATGGVNTINLTVVGSYTLTVPGIGENASATGDLDMNNQNLTIQNTSGGAVTIDGGGLDRVFDIGPMTAAQLTMSNVTVRGGNNTFDGQGGGFRVRFASSLSLTNVIVTQNQVGDAASAGEGGGIANGGTTILTDVTISNNTAIAAAPGGSGGGGGISNRGPLTVTSSTINNNTAQGDTTGVSNIARGGGMAN